MNNDNSKNILTSDRRVGIGGRLESSIYKILCQSHFVKEQNICKHLPRSRSFHTVHACSRHAFASSVLCCDNRTDARDCRASVLPGSVVNASCNRFSQLFSASGSKLSEMQSSVSVYVLGSTNTHQRSYEGSIHISTMPMRARTTLRFTSTSSSLAELSSARSFPFNWVIKMSTAA